MRCHAALATSRLGGSCVREEAAGGAGDDVRGRSGWWCAWVEWVRER